MTPVSAFALLAAIDILAAVVAFWLQRPRSRNASEPDIAWSVLLLAIAMAVIAHALVTIQLGRSIDMTESDQQMFVVFGSFASGLLPALVFGRMAIQKLATSSVDTLFGAHFSKPPETDFSKARALDVRGDIDGAVRMCRDYFTEQPETPRALFEAERFLSKAGRNQQALEILREIMHIFEKEDEIWAKAAFRAANIHENDLDDRATADRLLHDVMKRVPQSELGHLAHGRINRTWDTKDTSPSLEP